MAKLYIEVKCHAPTDTKGKRTSAEIKGKGRKYFPWGYEFEAAENLRGAAYDYAQQLLLAAGHNMAEPVLTEIISTKTGLPVGYVWEG